jgi:hypothetical protein
MRKPLVVIGAVLLGLLAVVLVLFRQDGDREPVSLGEMPAIAVPDEPREAAEVAPAATRAREAVAAAVADEAEPAAAPPSYRENLGALVGRIVDTDGQPKPGMKIEALTVLIEEIFPQLDRMFEEAPIDFEEVKDRTTTDEDGRFRFEGLEPRAFWVLGIDRKGPRSTVRFVDRAPNAGETVDLGDIRLDPFVVFTGRVVDEKRSPIAGARVRASNLPAIAFQFGVQDLKPGFSVAFQQDFGRSDGWRVARVPSFAFRLLEKVPLPETVSGDDGTFRLEGVPTGLVTVMVDRDDYVSLVHGPVPSGDGGERAVGDLSLDDGETLAGVVVDAAGQPIPDADVLAGPQIDIAPLALVVPVGRTDSQGRFSARGFKDVEHVVCARTARGVEWSLVRDVVPGYDDAKIVIGDSYSVAVLAFTASGEPLPKPKVVVQPISELPLHPLLVPPISLAGRIRHREDGATVVADLSPGNYSVLVKAEGYAIAKVDADLESGPNEVRATLEPEYTAEVTVVGRADREPVWFATVGAFDEGADEKMQGVPVLNQRTTEDGKVRMKGLRKGNYKLVVFHPGYAETMADLVVPGEPLVIELPQGGTIEGWIHENRAAPDPDRFIGIGKRDGGFPRFNVTDDEGRFRITHLAPGDYTATIVRRFADRGVGDFVGAAQNFAPERFASFSIAEGQVTTLEVDLLGVGGDGPKAKLRGRVLINGSAPGELSIAFNSRGTDGDFDREDWMARRKMIVCDPSGAFDFGEVLAGGGTLEVNQPGQKGNFNFGRLARVEVELAENETKDVAVDIRVGRVRGRVVDERTNAPLGTAEVRLRSDDPPKVEGAQLLGNEWNASARMQTTSDKDGNFAFPMVPRGRYRVDVDRGGYASRRVSGLEVEENSEPPFLTVRLMSGVRVEGRVSYPITDPDQDARFAFIRFEGLDESGGSSGSRVDLEDSSFAVDELMPGRYRVTMFAGNARSLAPIEIDVPRDGLKDAMLAFEVEIPVVEKVDGATIEIKDGAGSKKP